MLIRLENGGIASAVCNYLNPIPGKVWGFEAVRVFGSEGMVEYDAELARVRLAAPGREPEILPCGPAVDYFDLFAASLLGGPAMPLTSAQELSPARWAIRARQQALAGG